MGRRIKGSNSACETRSLIKEEIKQDAREVRSAYLFRSSPRRGFVSEIRQKLGIMFNKPSDSPSRDYEAYVHIVNYIAAALAARIYQGIPQLSVPSPREVGDLNRLWREYFLTHKSEVLSIIRRRRTEVSDDMQDVIRNLQQHTYSLRDPRGNVSCEISFTIKMD